MAHQCPHCGREYDIALFQFGKKVLCDCGGILDATRPRIIKKEFCEASARLEGEQGSGESPEPPLK